MSMMIILAIPIITIIIISNIIVVSLIDTSTWADREVRGIWS